jgi:alpha-beta hydrolase superfamily lysophospholipase
MIRAMAAGAPVEIAWSDTKIRSRGGIQIHIRRFAAAGRTAGAERALLAIVPGISDHGERYPLLVRQAIADGFGAAAVDTRGHGRSGGRRGHVESFDDFLVDVDGFLAALRREDLSRAKPPPIFLFGHSMGALIVLAYLSAGFGRGSGLRGAIVQAPPFRVTTPIPRWKTGLARALSRVAPSVLFATELRPEDLSRDPAVGERYLHDPLCHHVCSPRLFTEITGRAARIFANPIDYGLPTLFTHGTADRMIDPEGTRSYFERSPLSDKALRLFPGARHEVHNDAPGELWREVRAFMEARIGP